MDVILQKFDYKYMAYEQELLRLEIQALLPDAVLEDNGRQLILHHVEPEEAASLDRLTYIAAYSADGVTRHTKQYKLEQNSGKRPKRQNTRYASHGIHEYKGKFNPQIVHALLNILGVREGGTVFDPFCGSGTTLVESAIWGCSSYGIDINPLAVQLAKLKIKMLTLDCKQARTALASTVRFLSEETGTPGGAIADTPRRAYLRSWLPGDTFSLLERLLEHTAAMDETAALLFRLSASNLIRDYSFQEPMDLRIRRRVSPMPEAPFVEAWAEMVARQLDCAEHAQQYIDCANTTSAVEQNDIRTADMAHPPFDAAITSPPYATALPYIDTQRISLVWLGLCEPGDIMGLESTLIGSREFHRVQKDSLHQQMMGNVDRLPEMVIGLVHQLQQNLTDQDGFRKKAVPLLLYRYFADMKRMFQNVYAMMEPGAKYALVVGNNKTTIGGELHVIDTPALLSQIASDTGWNVMELFPLQTYQRYGLHAKNAVTRETLILLEKGAE